MDFKKVRTFCFEVLIGVLFSVAISSWFDQRNQTSMFKPSPAFC